MAYDLAVTRAFCAEAPNESPAGAGQLAGSLSDLRCRTGNWELAMVNW